MTAESAWCGAFAVRVDESRRSAASARHGRAPGSAAGRWPGAATSAAAWRKMPTCSGSLRRSPRGTPALPVLPRANHVPICPVLQPHLVVRWRAGGTADGVAVRRPAPWAARSASAVLMSMSSAVARAPWKADGLPFWRICSRQARTAPMVAGCGCRPASRCFSTAWATTYQRRSSLNLYRRVRSRARSRPTRQQCLRLAGPVADAVVEPAAEPGKFACRFGVVEAA